MIYYLKTANREELYAALVSSGAAREIENENGEKVYDFVEGAEFDEIGAIVAPLKKFVRDESGEIVFKTRQELVVEATEEVLWNEGDELPEGVVAGDVKTPAVEAEYKTVTTEEPQTETVYEEVDGENVDVIEPLKMLSLGDIKTLKKEQVLEQILIQEAVEEVLWTEEETLPEGTEVGDVKIVGQEAVYETKVLEAAQPAVFYTEEEIAESGDAYHANIRGIAGEVGKQLPSIKTPTKPARIWWT
tara:strand:- start:171 stop:908 length:738 start_codon:yes stop_codon:yes gene_type:complete